VRARASDNGSAINAVEADAYGEGRAPADAEEEAAALRKEEKALESTNDSPTKMIEFILTQRKPQR